MLVASLVAVASFLVSQAAAHGGVTSYIIGGTNYVGWSPYNGGNQRTIERPYSSYDPILSATASSISCNNNNQAGPSQLIANVKAGDKITAIWSQWTHMEGPVMVYMARCPSGCATANSAQLDWFKIDHSGLISGSLAKGSWGNGIVLKELKWTSTIPSVLADGEYLIRHELLALHQANTPQFYPECAHLSVSGGGGQTPPSSATIKLPGGYSMSHPGIMVDIYSSNAPNVMTYQVPGPAIWPGSGSSQPPANTQPPVVTTAPPATSQPPVVTQPPVSGTIPQWGQCGGQGWSGATACVSPYKCVKMNDYYSQCQ